MRTDESVVRDILSAFAMLVAGSLGLAVLTSPFLLAGKVLRSKGLKLRWRIKDGVVVLVVFALGAAVWREIGGAAVGFALIFGSAGVPAGLIVYLIPQRWVPLALFGWYATLAAVLSPAVM